MISIAIMAFTCFYTYYKDAGTHVPITVGYDCTPAVHSALQAYPASQFVHSGNWWTIDPAKRTKEVVLDRQLSLANEHTAGFMSMNVQPGNDPMYWIEKEGDENHMQACLDNATFARDELRSRGIDIPVYCTLQPSTVAMAETWFQRAIDAGHQHLCMGVSEFLKSPRHRIEGIKRIMQITDAVARLQEQWQLSFHLSGLTSYALLPVVAALGATSTDGSTPVQSALAYGTVFFPGSGKGMRASQMLEQQEMLDWNCTCNACKGKDKADLFRSFSEARMRVTHNLLIWEQLIMQINNDVLRDPAGWLEISKKEISPASKKTWLMALELLNNR
jgi:hypothetical protein